MERPFSSFLSLSQVRKIFLKRPPDFPPHLLPVTFAQKDRISEIMLHQPLFIPRCWARGPQPKSRFRQQEIKEKSWVPTTNAHHCLPVGLPVRAVGGFEAALTWLQKETGLRVTRKFLPRQNKPYLMKKYASIFSQKDL